MHIPQKRSLAARVVGGWCAISVRLWEMEAGGKGKKENEKGAGEARARGSVWGVGSIEEKKV